VAHFATTKLIIFIAQFPLFFRYQWPSWESVPEMSPNNENEFKGRLITAVKKEVKQVMEESVTRKFVHEESGSVTSLCAAVEACLSQGESPRNQSFARFLNCVKV
jgi:hypothetical protein